MPITSIDPYLCDGCGACEKSCPSDVIRMGTDGKAYPAFPEDCLPCMMCDLACSRNAIEIKLIKRGYFEQTWKK